MIHLVFITFNRLDYTRRALASVLADPDEAFRLTLWDNGSTDGTREFFQSIDDPRIEDIVLCESNKGQVEAINSVWSDSKADLFGKLDNDCLVTPGWTRTLARAHRDIDRLGVVACWHFFPDDFDYPRARHKIETFGAHRILRHPWTCGTGFLIKRETYQELGPVTGTSTTSYWLRMATRGYVNGFYYPLIHQEHMDDPKSQYSELRDDAGFERARRTTMIHRRDVQTRHARWRWREMILENLLDEPYAPERYLGWRGRLWRLRNRLRLRAGL
jgi:glycosyltransferase involved in cell wall biosynthesis